MKTSEPTKTAVRPEMTDVKTLRARARSQLEDGAVTQSYALDAEKVCAMLNEALATELVCVLRYKRHYFMAQGLLSSPIADEFLEHANEEQEHADQIAERIVQLGGEPDFDPQTLTERSHAEYVEGKSLVDMIKENLVAERIAIDSYREMAQYVGEDDPTTRRMLEQILSAEEQHADEMRDLLEGMPDTLERAGRDANRAVR